MIKKSEVVEYRNKSELPTEEGWYFGREKMSRDSSIMPCFVAFFGYKKSPSNPILRVNYGEDYLPLEEFDWFGKVPTIKEG